MRSYRLLLGMMVIAFFLLQAQAEAGDPLDPSQMGESMSMPLSPELIQAAVKAGVITESNSQERPDREQPSFFAGPEAESDAINSIVSLS